jgi:hypothetical protein
MKNNVINIVAMMICSFAAGVQSERGDIFWLILTLLFAVLNAFVVIARK